MDDPVYTACTDCGSFEATPWVAGFDMAGVKIAPPEAAAGHPKEGGMICRNPADPSARWYMSAEFFAARHPKHEH